MDNERKEIQTRMEPVLLPPGSNTIYFYCRKCNGGPVAKILNFSIRTNKEGQPTTTFLVECPICEKRDIQEITLEALHNRCPEAPEAPVSWTPQDDAELKILEISTEGYQIGPISDWLREPTQQ